MLRRLYDWTMGLAAHQLPPFALDKRLLRIKIGKSMICDDDFDGLRLLNLKQIRHRHIRSGRR